MMKCLRKPALIGLVTLLLAAGSAWAQPAAPAVPPAPTPAAPRPHAPAVATAIMPVDQVRIGMKGYGMTVFKGTEIEPFPVTVVSVVAHQDSPRRSIVWIESDDPRMLESGPVQGMSGSPIYLWDEGEPQQLGQGGRLIGAFAFGFSLSKGCLVGVQPIEYMREVGGRAASQADEAQDGQIVASAARPGPQTALRTMSALKRIAAVEGVASSAGERLASYEALLRGMQGQLPGQSLDEPDWAREQMALPAPPRPDGQVVAMRLPLALGSQRLVDLMSPLLQPLGLEPVAMGGGVVGGPPPTAVNLDELRLEPGSVLAVPLAFGDLDLSAAGTVTDVLPDGTVLGFGHAMFGQGRVAVPMATGYVHFIVPRISTSFKMAGSVQLQGSIRQDEVAAVAGTAGVSYTTAPVKVQVHMPGHAAQTYNYQVVNHPSLTPSLASMLSMRSLAAERDLPMEHTIRLQGEVRFSGDRSIDLDVLMTDTGLPGLMMELVPPIMLAMQNPFEPMDLAGMDLTLRVEPQRLLGTIVNARLDRAQVAPGETVGVTVWIQPEREAIKVLRLTLTVPAETPEGEYPLSVTDAQTHLRQMMSSRPHLFATETADELVEMMQQVLSVERDAVYLTLLLPEQGVAMGRREMAHLPTSRRAMLLTPTSTQAVPFRETVHSQTDAEMVIRGERSFTLTVREPE